MTKKKLDQEQTINGLGKPLRKKPDPKYRKKTVKIKMKLGSHAKKKPLAIFVQTPFSLL